MIRESALGGDTTGKENGLGSEGLRASGQVYATRSFHTVDPVLLGAP